MLRKALLTAVSCSFIINCRGEVGGPEEGQRSSTAAGPPSISVNHPHLTVAAGKLGTATVRWTAKGRPNVRVYSAHIGAPAPGKLLGKGETGSVKVPWVQPPGVVFRLYAGMHPQPVSWVSVTAKRPPTRTFGITYWPLSHSNVLLDSHWNDLKLRQQVSADLDHISSLGGNVIRLLFWDTKSGLDGKPQCGGSTLDHAVIAEQAHNLVNPTNGLLRLAALRGLKVVVSFGSLLQKIGTRKCCTFKPGKCPYCVPGGQASCDLEQEHRWWMNAYPSHQAFIRDAVGWINGFIKAIEHSAHADTVIFYDLYTEYGRDAFHGEYLRGVYDGVVTPRGHLPLGKISVSPLAPRPDSPAHDDARTLKRELRGRRLDYVDFHTYKGGKHYRPVVPAYRHLVTLFPHSSVVMTEYGHCCEPFDEAVQQRSLLELTTDITKRTEIPYFLSWMLYANTPKGLTNAEYGWIADTSGRLIHEKDPHHVMGSLPARFGFNLALNPDFEGVVAGVPTGWSAGGAGAQVTLTSGSGGQAATNTHFARLKATGATAGAMWLTSSVLRVTGGRLFANVYLRAGAVVDLRVTLRQYDAQRRWLGRATDLAGPAYTPNGWAFSNYLQRVAGAKGWAGHFRLDPRARYASFGVAAKVAGDPAIVDVDTVSIWQR